MAATQIDVFSAVEVPDTAALGALDYSGWPRARLSRVGGAHASGEVLASFFVLLLNATHDEASVFTSHQTI